MKKGITPVISIVLLLLILVAIVGIFFGWIVGIFNTATAEDPIAQLNVNKRAIIDNAVCYPALNVVKLTIKASGSEDLAPGTVSIYLDGSLTGIESPVIESGKTQTVNVPLPTDMDCTAGYTVKITDPAGISNTEDVSTITATCAADFLCKDSGCSTGDEDCTCIAQGGEVCVAPETCPVGQELDSSDAGCCVADQCA